MSEVVGDVEVAVRLEFERPAWSVDEVMVATAEQDKVFEFGFAVTCPPGHVVGVTPGDFAGAARESATAIAVSDSTKQIGRAHV